MAANHTCIYVLHKSEVKMNYSLDAERNLACETRVPRPLRCTSWLVKFTLSDTTMASCFSPDELSCDLSPSPMTSDPWPKLSVVLVLLSPGAVESWPLGKDCWVVSLACACLVRCGRGWGLVWVLGLVLGACPSLNCLPTKVWGGCKIYFDILWKWDHLKINSFLIRISRFWKTGLYLTAYKFQTLSGRNVMDTN